jgi:alkyl sulfatase BDS1-like metallo-beta-lactamase superfamily hydrolase
MVYTYKERFNNKYKIPKGTSHSLKDISDITGYKLSGLKTIFNKGIGAYKTNPESVRPQVKSPEQWAFARVYSAVMGGKTSVIDAPHLIRK